MSDPTWRDILEGTAGIALAAGKQRGNWRRVYWRRGIIADKGHCIGISGGGDKGGELDRRDNYCFQEQS